MIEARMRVPFSYLDRQFADIDAYLADVKALVLSGDFTLGKAVGEFEQRFAAMCGLPHAVGVGSGTDALILSLEILGIGPGDEVITAANTFVATAGAIAMARATPVFVDNTEGYVIDPDRIEAAITPHTKAIVPVHYSGNVCDMPRIMAIARKHGLAVVEDACQSIAARFDDTPVGSWGDTAAFSLHPLKNLNVWGDGGVIVTRRADLAEKLRLYRNHGLVGRDDVVMWGHNSRLDSLHAVIGNRLIEETAFITAQRIANARRYDEAFADVPQVRVPARAANIVHTYHLYMLRVERRDELMAYLTERGVEAKVHYPIPLHLQGSLATLGYKQGDFPVTEQAAAEVLALPMYPELREDEQQTVVDAIAAFYA